MRTVYIILVNWNGWRDTIECLESVFRLDYPSFRVIVCDNASADDSLERIAEWALGKVNASCSNARLLPFSFPAHPKPIRFARILPGEQTDLAGREEKLFLVQTGANLGFAGANNVGLRLALLSSDGEYAWLLNNDTVVDPGALSALVQTMRDHPGSGMCGSMLLYYHDPELIQALGGSKYNRWLARVGNIGLGLRVQDRPDVQEVERSMRYVAGASMLVSRPFLEQVGLMNEQYFLYFEEIDWSTRAAGRFVTAYSPESIVYHKEGASIGTSDLKNKPRSAVSELFAARNRILFTRTYYPGCLPTVIAAMSFSAMHRLMTGQLERFAMVLRGIGSGLFAFPYRG